MPPELLLLTPLPDVAHIGKSLKCSWSNWFIDLNGQMSNLVLIRSQSFKKICAWELLGTNVLKYVWNVYCVITNHKRDLQPQKIDEFPFAMKQICFVSKGLKINPLFQFSKNKIISVTGYLNASEEGLGYF